MKPIIIIGLGLIGGSIAKHLSQINGMHILALDQNKESIEHALANKFIHGSLKDLHDLKLDEYQGSMVIIATPPKASVDILRTLNFLFNSNVTITDTSSTKLALDIILQEFNYPNNVVLSHPVAGSHLSGETNALVNLFQDKNVILSYHDSVQSAHIEKVENLWRSLGATFIKIDAKTHDHIFAHSSHLPHIASYALLMTIKKLDQANISQFSGGGLGEFLRLSSSSPEMWADIFSLNQSNIGSSIESLIDNLDYLKTTIEKNPEGIKSLLLDLKQFQEEHY